MLAKNDTTQNSTLRSSQDFIATSVNLSMLLQTLCHLSQHYLYELTKPHCNRIFLHVPTWCKH